MKDIFLFFVCLNLIYNLSCRTEETTYDLILETKLYNPKYFIYEYGMFALNTNTSEFDIFDESDIEDQIFYTNYSVDYFVYNLKCNFWKPKEENTTILCKVIDKKNRPSGSTNPDFIVYKYIDKTIKIIFKFYPYFSNNYLPFLYADKQEIDLSDGKGIYELKFKIGVYKDEDFIAIYSDKPAYYYIHSNCKIQGKELVCKLPRKLIEGNMISESKSFYVTFYGENYIDSGFGYILGVYIYNKNPHKEVVYISLTNLLTDAMNQYEFVSYDTNVTNISAVSTSQFSIMFNHIKKKERTSSVCMLKKFNGNESLKLFCDIRWGDMGNYTLEEFDYDVPLNNINNKYSFIIKGSKNDQIFSYSYEYMGEIFSLKPEVLNFADKDILNISFIGRISKERGLSLDSDLPDLDCKYYYWNYASYYFTCTIHKNYFKGKKNGIYYVHIANHLGHKNALYHLPPINVILNGNYLIKFEKLLYLMLLFFLI